MEKQLKSLTALFGISVVGIVFCFVMTVYTAIQNHAPKTEVNPRPIVTPAVNS